MRRTRTPRGHGIGAALAAVAMRPRLWLTAGRAMRRLVPSRWWMRPPFLPVPHRDYVRFRLLTAAGPDSSAAAEPADLIQWLEWCRHWPAAAAVHPSHETRDPGPALLSP
ncbi:MAG: hypothetical protein OXM54_09080 [Acidimicrobiaceae bacterium]|nr:hypothetical protein [Acidimicrobiaceae bacterium]